MKRPTVTDFCRPGSLSLPESDWQLLSRLAREEDVPISRVARRLIRLGLRVLQERSGKEV